MSGKTKIESTKGKQGDKQITNHGIVDSGSKKGTLKLYKDNEGKGLAAFKKQATGVSKTEIGNAAKEDNTSTSPDATKQMDNLATGGMSEEEKTKLYKNIYGSTMYEGSSLTPGKKSTTTQNAIVDNKAKGDAAVSKANDAPALIDGTKPTTEIPTTPLREGTADKDTDKLTSSSDNTRVETDGTYVSQENISSDDTKPADYNNTSAATTVTVEKESSALYLDEDILRDKLQMIDIMLKSKIGKETLSETGDYSERYIHNYNRNKKMIVGEHAAFRRGHIFMTMPSCNMLIKKDGKLGVNVGFDDAIKNWHGECADFHLNQMIVSGNMYLAKWLCADVWEDKEVFMFPLMNMLESVSGLPTFELKTRQSPMNIKNNYTEMAVDTMSDISGQTVNLTFTDDKKGTALKLLYFWIKYMEAFSSSGTVKPDLIHASEKRLPYTTTMYIFVTDESNANLTYWWQLTGCFPKTLASSTQDIRGLMNDQGKIEVPFKVSSASFLTPAILADFNILNAKKMKAMGSSSNATFNSAESTRAFIAALPETTNYTGGREKGYYDDLPNTFFIKGKKMGFLKDDGSGTQIDYGEGKMSTWRNILCMFNYDEYTSKLDNRLSSDATKMSQLEGMIEEYEPYTTEKPVNGWRIL